MNRRAIALLARSSAATTVPWRLSAAAVAAAAIAATAWLTVLFTAWAGRHNAVYYSAVEVGRRPHYPSGHFADGLALGAMLAASVALSIVAIAAVVARKPRWPLETVVLVSIVAFAIGAAVPASLISPLYAAVPVLLGACLIAIVAVLHASHGRKGSPRQLSGWAPHGQPDQEAHTALLAGLRRKQPHHRLPGDRRIP